MHCRLHLRGCLKVSSAGETGAAGFRFPLPSPSVPIIETLNPRPKEKMFRCQDRFLQRALSSTAFITRQPEVPAASTRVHPPAKWSAQDTPRGAARAGLRRFQGKVTGTDGTLDVKVVNRWLHELEAERDRLLSRKAHLKATLADDSPI